MLYDNGQILEYLADLWSSGVRVPAIKRAIADTIDWLQREMTHADGYFYAAQDADNFIDSESVEPEEGAFYVWSYAELQSSLSETELAELEREFAITPQGNFEGKIVLQRLNDGVLSAETGKALAKLFKYRYGRAISEIDVFPPAKDNQEAKTRNWSGRIPPVTDTKGILAWNSLMISGLVRAFAVFPDESSLNLSNVLDLAIKATEFILENQWIDGRMQRLNYDGVATVPAQSEDYALLIKALLDLQAACPENSRWLDKAREIQAEFDRLLWSSDGGYFNNSSDAGKELLVRERSYIDNATPSANGIAIANLVRLSLLTDNLEYRDRAEAGLKAFGAVLAKSPTACPSLFTALDWFLHGTSVKTSIEYAQQLQSQYLPTTVLRIVTDLPDDSIALVCQGLSCLEPATTIDQVVEQIQSVS